MLVMMIYAKQYASTIYQRLIVACFSFDNSYPENTSKKDLNVLSAFLNLTVSLITALTLENFIFIFHSIFLLNLVSGTETCLVYREAK